MTRELGLPTPPGLTIPASAGRACMTGRVDDELMADVLATLKALTLAMGRAYGDPARPLLVSVRSGAAVSMPGMMDTILNVGLTPATLEAFVAMTGSRAVALDCYRRFLVQFAVSALGLQVHSGAPAHDTAAIAQDIELLRQKIADAAGAALLDDPVAVLSRAIAAVFASWNSPKAQHYRRQAGLPEGSGTAVNIQAMVFGNLGESSGTGVVFSRDPATGAPGAVGDYLPDAQGEAVVAGQAAPLPYSDLARINPHAHTQLASALRRLEAYFQDMVDVEFTIEAGTLWILQARHGKRTPGAAARIAVDLANDPAFAVTRGEALARLPQGYFDGAGDVSVASGGGAIARGIGASPGVATGAVVFTAEDAVERAEQENVILVRQETSPADVHGMSAAAGILTTLGGQMSHAAVVARDWSLPAVVGASEIHIEPGAFTVGGQRIAEGDIISLDGRTGEIFLGAVNSTITEDPVRATLTAWAQESAAGGTTQAATPPTTQTMTRLEEDMPRLQGKTVIITGATGGIGAATARTLLNQGANIVIVARNHDKLAALEAALANPDKVAMCQGDVSSEVDTARYVSFAIERFGGIDVLFANAGSEGAIKPLVDLTVEEFDAIQSTNVRGTWLAIKHCAPNMIARGGGSIILTSSVAGVVGVPGLSAYATSKHALVGLAQVAALEMAAQKVRTNVIAPAPIDNDMMRSIEKQAAPDAPEAAAAGFRALIPMGRYGTNEEVANMVLFLASDESSFCNGNVYAVDGGFLAA